MEIDFEKFQQKLIEAESQGFEYAILVHNWVLDCRVGD